MRSVAILLLTLILPLTGSTEETRLVERISGLEYGTIPASGGILSSETHLVRASLDKYRVGVVRAADYDRERSNVRNLGRSTKATACINANFFDTRGSPLGLVISDGRRTSKVHNQGRVLTGVLSVTRSAVQIVHRELFSERGVLEAIQAGPRLLEKGSITAGLKQGASFSRRSSVCLDGANNIIFATSASGIRGAELDSFARLLQQAPVHCMEALNLDGGGSSQLYLANAPEQEEVFVQGTDEVPVALCLYERSFW